MNPQIDQSVLSGVIPTAQPQQEIKEDRSIETILKICAVSYVITLIGWWAFAPKMDLFWRLWVPFLIANLAVWGTVMIMALYCTIRDAVLKVHSKVQRVTSASRVFVQPLPETESPRTLADRMNAYLTRFLEVAR